MSSISSERELLLPRGTCLVHIGPRKTGTTAIQYSASKCREKLSEYGVYYPGDGINHKREIFSFCGWSSTKWVKPSQLGASKKATKSVPPKGCWNRLKYSIGNKRDKRVFISHEDIASFEKKDIRQFVRDIGSNRIHIVITLRQLTSVYVSHWIQELKTGPSITLDEWLKRFYGISEHKFKARLRRNMDFGAIVESWAEVAGPDNVTVIVADKKNKGLLTRSFEDMLGLPSQTLTENDLQHGLMNRSLSRLEAEVIRQFNERSYDKKKNSWPAYRQTIQNGVITNLQANYQPGNGFRSVLLPQWAASRVVEDGKRFSREIVASGVRVIGSLDELYGKPKEFAEDQPPLDQNQVNFVVEALTGAFCGAEKIEKTALDEINRVHTRHQKAEKKNAQYGRKGRQMPQGQRIDTAAHAFSTRDLFRALKYRLKHKLRTGKSMPLR